MLNKLLLALCIGGFSLSACSSENAAPAAAVPTAAGPAVTPAAEQIVRQAIRGLSTKVQVDSIEPAPMPGFYQVIASGKMVYVSADGRYMLDGALVNLGRHTNESDAAWARFRKAELAKVPASEIGRAHV